MEIVHEEKWYHHFMRKKHSLYDTYRFPGFRPNGKVVGVFGDPYAQVVVLRRCQKKQPADSVAVFMGHITTVRHGG